MAALNVSLVVAAYRDDASAAAEDFQTIKGLDDTYVVAAVGRPRPPWSPKQPARRRAR